MRKRLVKGLVCLGNLFINSFFALLYCVASTVKYVFCGKKLLLKLAILGSYALMIWSVFCHPIMFKILLGVILAVAFFFAWLMIQYHNTAYEEKGQKSTSDTGKIAFFDGMTVEMAKKEYRRLMKEYHPDNSGGNVEMTQRVVAAYQSFQAANGK